MNSSPVTIGQPEIEEFIFIKQIFD